MCVVYICVISENRIRHFNKIHSLHTYMNKQRSTCTPHTHTERSQRSWGNKTTALANGQAKHESKNKKEKSSLPWILIFHYINICTAYTTLHIDFYYYHSYKLYLLLVMYYNETCGWFLCVNPFKLVALLRRRSILTCPFCCDTGRY